MFAYFITLAFTLSADTDFVRPLKNIITTVGIPLRSELLYFVLYLSIALLRNLLDYKITGFQGNSCTV